MISNEGIPPNRTELVDGAHYNIPVALRQPYDRQTEPYHVRCKKIDIPKLIPALEFLTEDIYRNMKKEEFRNESNIATRKVLLRLIEKKPELWARKKVCVEEETWQLLAVDFYKRTGAIWTVEYIRKIFGLAKKVLREKLIESIKANENRYDTEATLAKWDLYYHIRFYREVLKELEDNLRSQSSNDTCEQIIEADAPHHLDYVLSVREVTKENGLTEKITEVQAPLVLDDNDTETTSKLEVPDLLPGLTMTVERYQDLPKEQFQKIIDLKTRKLIIAMIEKYPHFWNNKNVFASRQEWEELGVEMYLRSGLILPVELIGSVFNQEKEKLRMLLELSIFKGHDSKQTEMELDNWDLYPQMKFFRAVTNDYEYEIIKRYKRLDYNKQLVDRTEQFSSIVPPKEEEFYQRLEELHNTNPVVDSILTAMMDLMNNPRAQFLAELLVFRDRFQEIEKRRREAEGDEAK